MPIRELLGGDRDKQSRQHDTAQHGTAQCGKAESSPAYPVSCSLAASSSFFSKPQTSGSCKYHTSAAWLRHYTDLDAGAVDIDIHNAIADLNIAVDDQATNYVVP